VLQASILRPGYYLHPLGKPLSWSSVEADWEFEVGGEAPVIDALWPGFVDLRQSPPRAFTLPEAAQLPALARALACLNAPSSPFWTSKCDVYPSLKPGEFDVDELDASPDDAAHATACYIDVLPGNGWQWDHHHQAAAACSHLCRQLHAIPLRCCRADLVIRACFVPGQQGLGLTAYLTACGPSAGEAAATLQAALTAFARTLGADSTVE